MRSPRSEEEALDQSELVWARFANTGEGYEDKHRAVKEVLGYAPKSGCPACEWDETHVERENGESRCSKCPIDAWRSPSEAGLCYETYGLYRIWADSGSEEERKGLARDILGLIRDSKENRRRKE